MEHSRRWILMSKFEYRIIKSEHSNESILIVIQLQLMFEWSLHDPF